MSKYLKETWRNKLVAVILVILGVMLIPVDYDATASVLLFLMSIYLFVTKKNVID